MLKTEKEAAKTRCCGPSHCGAPGDAYTDEGRYCIGADCMGWRFAHGAETTIFDVDIPAYQAEWMANNGWQSKCITPKSPTNEGLRQDRLEWHRPARGYCGYAGKPE